MIKPLVFHYAADVNVFDIDDEWLVGNSILVSPVVKENATNRIVYLPGGPNELWYNTELSLLYYGGNYTIDVDNGTNLYFYRGGEIVARRDTFRQSTSESLTDPFNLYIFLNSSNEASGTLYVDDGISFDYKNRRYIYRRYQYDDGTFSFRDIDSEASYNGTIVIGSIILYRPPSRSKQANLEATQPVVEYLNPKMITFR